MQCHVWIDHVQSPVDTPVHILRHPGGTDLMDMELSPAVTIQQVSSFICMQSLVSLKKQSATIPISGWTQHSCNGAAFNETWLYCNMGSVAIIAHLSPCTTKSLTPRASYNTSFVGNHKYFTAYDVIRKLDMVAPAKFGPSLFQERSMCTSNMRWRNALE